MEEHIAIVWNWRLRVAPQLAQTDRSQGCTIRCCWGLFLRCFSRQARSSVSGINLGARKNRSDSEGVVVHTNPLLAARSGSGKSVRTRSVSTAPTTPESILAAAASSSPLSPSIPTSRSEPSLVSVAAGVVPADLPPPPLLPSVLAELRASATALPQQQQQPEPASATVKFAFVGSSEKELSVEQGSVVSVVRSLPSGWSVVRNKEGRQGAVPTSYIIIQSTLK
jgi:hypothetical protein